MTTSLISQNLSALLASFPASAADPDAVMAGYRIAVSEFDDRQISLAVTAFIQGRVKDHNPKFAPSAAELARECRNHMSADDYRRHCAALALPRPEPDKPVAISEEERARVAKKMQAFSDVRSGRISADEFKAITGITWFSERATA